MCEQVLSVSSEQYYGEELYTEFSHQETQYLKFQLILYEKNI